MSQNNAVSKVRFSQHLQSNAIQKFIGDTLGSEKRTRDFVASISSYVGQNPTLATCDNNSIITAVLTGEVLGLSPSNQLGHYYLVPYDNKRKGVKEAQFQLGYKGYIQLAIRSGQYKTINALPIKACEFVSYDRIDEKLVVKDDFTEKEYLESEVVGYYAVLELVTGFKKTIYWSKEKMELHADNYSSAFNIKTYELLKAGKIPEKDLWKYSSFWYKDFDAMANKTLLRQLISKWGIMSIEMQTAFKKDMAVEDLDGNVRYVDNEKESGSEIEVVEQDDGFDESDEVVEKEETIVDDETGEVDLR